VRTPKVLVVTDDQRVRTLVSKLLAGEGLQLIYAEDGEQAIAGVARLRPEVAVIFDDAVRRTYGDARRDGHTPMPAGGGDHQDGHSAGGEGTD